MTTDAGALRIALAGNPNCGKTTIFNALTGSKQHVGNYAGVTVEKKEGTYKHLGRRVDVIDLPGLYSLSYHSPEEQIAQMELLSGETDVVVGIVDSSALARNMSFIVQLMHLELPMVLCLNMSDEAKKAGQRIDVEKMSQLLGMPVIETVAPKSQGITELKDAVFLAAESVAPSERLRFSYGLREALSEISKKLPYSSKEPALWLATKLLLEDEYYIERLAQDIEAHDAIAEAKAQREHIEADTKMDIQLYVTEQYYGFIDGLLKKVLINTQRADARALSDKIDRVLVHPYLGLPFFFLIVYALFELTFSLGQYPMDWIESGFVALSDWLKVVWPADKFSFLQSLLIDGVIAGVGGVIVFLPNILILFFGISFLEDSGYMARSAYLMDKMMHRFGLHGRSFIPLITGFGCTIPGIMATRTIGGLNERLTTMFILPLMSCGARLPIWLLLVPAFFPESMNAPVLMGIYVFGIIVALILAFVLRKSVFKGAEEPFVMELPPYRMPTLRASITHMLERAWLYLKKAGTVILAVSIVMWALMSFPKMDDEARAEVQSSFAAAQNHDALGAEAQDPAAFDAYLLDAELQYSFAGRIGKLLEPVLKPMGFDWKIATALIGAFAAKEVFVAQLGIVYSLGEEAQDREDLRSKIRNDYSLITGISLIIFLLIATPCMATVAIMRRESGRWKWAFAQFFGLTAIAYALSTSFYQIASLILGS
ncbi:MAG: ferrous iron transport protein B [Bradymonadales bacterium]|jgi:ferrous iron transport protein B